jgi:hypothetical protein
MSTDDSSNLSYSDSDLDSVDGSLDNEVCENFIPQTFFKSQKQLCYYKMVDRFFKKLNIETIKKMVDIINADSIISLRVLEWVVTKSNKKSVNIKIGDNEYFSINIMYKAQLKSYKKKNFDPFRRDKKFYYKYNPLDDNKNVLTTLGQLNFFKWAISNKIIDYVEKNYEEINRSMISYNKEEKIKKTEKKKKKVEIITTKTKNKIEEKKASTHSNNSSINNKKMDGLEKFTISFD